MVASVNILLTEEDEKNIYDKVQSIEEMIETLEAHPAATAILYEEIYCRYVINKVIKDKSEVRPLQIVTNTATILIMPTLHDSDNKEPTWIWSSTFK